MPPTSQPQLERISTPDSTASQGDLDPNAQMTNKSSSPTSSSSQSKIQFAPQSGSALQNAPNIAASLPSTSPSISPSTQNVNGSGLPSRLKLPKEQPQLQRQKQQKHSQDASDKAQSPSNDTGNSQNAKLADASGEKKLSNAELKKKQKAEKAARRAAEKGAKEAPGQGQPSHGGQIPAAKSGGGLTRRRSSDKGATAKASEGGKQQHHKRTPSASNSGKATQGGAQAAAEKEKEARLRREQQERALEEMKRVAIFGHLHSQHKKMDGVATAHKDVHPAVLALGLQIKEFVICGSNARCGAMLLAFKRVIESYTTPPGHALSRHLNTHLSTQITHLTRHSRPLSTSQANAIRHLKLVLSRIDPSLPEPSAKSHLLSSIDTFLREKITLADEVIARTAAEKIVDGDVILVFGKSSIVEKTLLQAYAGGEGKPFAVIVVDSRPLFEGRNLARSLSAQGIPTTYLLYTALDHAVRESTKVFLGASAMMSNGRLYSRVGTAGVAMMAKECGSGERGRPVIVLCETVKFSGGSGLDGGVGANEIAGEDLLIKGGIGGGEEDDVFTGKEPRKQATAAAAGGQEQGKKQQQSKGKQQQKDESSERKHNNNKDDDEEDDVGDAGNTSTSTSGSNPLQGWKTTRNQGLQLLNLMYDVTPAEYLDMVITELGCLPPSSVPVVIGLNE